MIFFQSKFLFFLFIFNTAYEAESNCNFEGYRASCNVYLRKGVMTNVTVIINHCNEPLDVTFIIKSDEYKFDWHYTYVITNPPQHQKVKGFKIPITLSVEFEKQKEQICASLNVDGIQVVPLITKKIEPKSFSDCALGLSNMGHIIIGILLTLLLFAVGGFVVFWICHRRKRTGAELVALVDDMEAESSQPSSSTSTSTVRLSDVRNSDCESPT